MRMNLTFTKMQGAGNDFVVIDAFTQPMTLTAEQIQQLAHRQFGVGFDQLLIVEKPTVTDADFRYRIFNADGGEVAQCGNGARCFVRFVHDKKLTDKTEICVETASGLIYPKLESNGLVTVNMGAPRFNPADIPFMAEAAPHLTYDVHVGEQTVNISAVSMGNPHAVLLVADTDSAPIAELGAALESHPRFPERVNVGFMQVLNPHEIKLRVFERGAGETLSCGTGACAAAVVGIQRDLLQSPVTVHTRGGDLRIQWAGGHEPVLMTGPAQTVFEGEIVL